MNRAKRLRYSKSNQIVISSLFTTRLYNYLLKEYGESLNDLLKGIQLVSPSDLVLIFKKNNYRLLDIGYNGVIFLSRESDSPQILKICHRILAAFGKIDLSPIQLKTHRIHLSKVRSQWSDFVEADEFKAIGGKNGKINDFIGGITPPLGELWGTLLWSLYRSEDLLIPNIMSSDGLVIIRKYVEGFALKKLIDQDKLNKTESPKMKTLWLKLVTLQNAAERMLNDVGLTIDLLNPNNILVAGHWPNWELRLIDQELVAPSSEAIDHINNLKQGTIKVESLDVPCFVVWPLIPEHITVSKVWGLSLEQAVDYLKTYYQISRISALERLANLPVLENKINPNAQDYSNQIEARKLLGLP